MGDRGKEFASIAYTVLVVDRRPGVKAAARLLGMNYSTLHSRLIGRTSFSADEIRDLVRAVPDPRLVSYLLDGSHFIAAKRPEPQETATSIQRGATRVVVGAADVLEIVDASIAGGGLDHRNQAVVLKEIEETQRALASLRLQIEGE